jgi:hypothetical protein
MNHNKKLGYEINHNSAFSTMKSEFKIFSYFQDTFLFDGDNSIIETTSRYRRVWEI